MHAPTYMLHRIRREIPVEVLTEAFVPVRYNAERRRYYKDHSTPLALDSAIRKLIIDGWVSMDLNLATGQEVYIRLAGLPYEMIDVWNIVYRIPKTLTDGRSITATYSISYGDGFSTNSYRANMNRSSPLLEAAGGMLLSNLPLPAVSTAYVTLVEENTVLISDINILPPEMYLRCRLSHEPDFKNIRAPYLPHLGELAVLAAKAYCYTNLLIPMDEGEQKGGKPINRFREVVDSFADASTLYKEYLSTTMKKVGYLNDPETMKRIWKMTVGGRR